MISIHSRIGRVTFDTLQQGVILFGATTAVSLLNYLFHVVQSRMLGPRDYATLAVMLSLFNTFSAPVSTLQALLADYIARFRARGELDKASHFSRTALKWLALASLPIGGLVVLFARPLASYLQIASITPVLILATALLPTLLNPALNGILQGLERFWILGLVLFVGALARLVAGVVLVWLGWGPSGGITAFTIAGVAGVAVGILSIWKLLRQPGAAHRLTGAEVSRYGGNVLVSGVLFTAMLNLDVVLVKHYFDPVSAGYYAAAATAGKMVFFIPSAIGTLMFPRVSAQLAAGGDGKRILRVSLLITLGLCAGMSAALFFLPGPITNMLFGSAYALSAALVGEYSIIMTLFALANLLMLYYLSAHDGRFAFVLGVSILLELGGVGLFHQTLPQVITVVGACIGAVVLFSEIWLRGLWGQNKP
jgi:O-antigen/teichoic acid export membrane protein